LIRDTRVTDATPFEQNYNTNKNRRRGDTHSPSHGVLGESSSANAWRDVRPHPNGSSQRPYGDAYFDDSTDDDDTGSVFTGFGRRDSVDHFGAGGANVGGARGSFETPSRLGSSSTRNSQRNLAALDQPSPSEPGPLKSIWQKIVKPKQAIALEGADTPSLIDNDGARSSTESTGHDSHAPSSLTSGGQGYRPDRFASATRGPALMFASVQQQPRSSHGDPDRDRLLSVGEARIPSSRSGSHSRGHSPQSQTRVAQLGPPGGRPPSSSSSNRPGGRAFGSSAPSQPSRSVGGNHSQRQSSPLVHIFDDEDD